MIRMWVSLGSYYFLYTTGLPRSTFRDKDFGAHDLFGQHPYESEEVRQGREERHNRVCYPGGTSGRQQSMLRAVHHQVGLPRASAHWHAWSALCFAEHTSMPGRVLKLRVWHI